MLWNLLGLQRKLDALFDDGWIRLGMDTEPLFHRPALRHSLSAYIPASADSNKAAADCV